MDADRLSAFVDTDYRRVVGAVAFVCGDPVQAEDAVQEALARACEQEARGARIENWAAWVTTVAMNHSRSALRRRGREHRANARFAAGRDDVSRLGETIAVADALAVRRAVSELPRRQREAVVLHYFLGFPVAEVATTIGVAEGTAKALLYQGRHRLAETLADDQPTPDVTDGRR